MRSGPDVSRATGPEPWHPDACVREVAAKPQKDDEVMPQRRAMNRILPVLLAFLSAVAVILQGGAFPATAQVPVGTSTPQATGVASVAPSVTMTVTATPVATVSPTLSPTVAASPSVTVTSTATATASVAPSVSPVRTSTSVVSPGSPVRSRKVETASVSNVAFDTIALGSAHTCGLTSTGIAYCWGSNGNGQLGDGSTDNRLLPVAVSGGHTFSMIAAGAGHTCGLTSAGAAYCWGFNMFGQLGDSSAPIHLLPVAVSGGLTFSTIAAGAGHTCGVASGTFAAWCWGYNANGQLGDNSTTDHHVPVAVSGGHTFSTISAGYEHMCGLTSAGAAYCWGSNGNGQLGDNSTTRRSVPTVVSGSLTFSSISAGSYHTCGVEADTFVAWCWGTNDYGQLGDGSTDAKSVPTLVDTNLTFSTMAAGEAHTCAIQQANVVPASVGRRSVSASAAYCWGYNELGQLGIATNADSLTPVQVARNLSYTVIGAGGGHTCGITAAATYCWGYNSDGQLGDGTTSNLNTPILSSMVDDAPASSGSSSSAPEATAVPTRTAVPTATPVPLRYTWTRDVDPASITVTSNRGYSRTIARATLDPVTGARTFKEWVRNSVTFDVYGVDENGLLVWADPSDSAIVSQIDWRQLVTMDMPAGAVDAIPVATPADGRLLWDVKGTGTIYVVGSDRFLHAIPDLRTFQASYTWSGVIPVTPAQLRLMPVGAPIPAVR